MLGRADFELLRTEVRFENEQIKGRFAGFAAFQSLLVMGLAITQNTGNRLASVALVAIPVLGIATAVLGLLAILAAVNQIRLYKKLINAYYDTTPDENKPPRVGARPLANALGSAYAVLGPILFGVLWGAALAWGFAAP